VGPLRELKSLAQVNHFWQEAIAKYIKTRINKQEFHRQLSSFLDVIEPGTNMLYHLKGGPSRKKTVKVSYQFLDEWDIYMRLFQESQSRFTLLCILLESYKLNVDKLFEVPYRSMNDDRIRAKIINLAQQKNLFKKGILKDVIVNVKYQIHMQTYDSKKNKTSESLTTKQKAVNKLTLRLEKMEDQHSKLSKSFNTVLKKYIPT
jgi:hypothetical protein